MRFAPVFQLLAARGSCPALVFFFETDCPACRLTAPYLNRLASCTDARIHVCGVSQDAPERTEEFLRQLEVRFPVHIDQDWRLSAAYDPETVPALYVVDAEARIADHAVGFDKAWLNRIAQSAGYGPGPLAEEHDGSPAMKPGCMSRHREPIAAGEPAPAIDLGPGKGRGAGRIAVSGGQDLYEYARAAFGDPLPVIPPTVERVNRMLDAIELDSTEVVARVPPCYGEATVEKIAANAVMAGCEPSLMRVLIPLLRAACDERFNLHGIQATTHFATPLIIVNGPVRGELGFVSAGNVFGNAARANSTLGRAFQLILSNLGGAKPGGIDMSTLGNPGKFSYCIAENQEDSPWEPLHVEHGFAPAQSAVTLFAAEGLRGVSEHTARSGRVLLKAICATLATVWSWRVCLMPEAFVILGPEHAATLARDGFSKQNTREFLFENTGVPLRAYAEDDGGEGTQMRASYEETIIAGERCYRKFRSPEAIRLVVAGGAAGKFSAVIGSWATGPRGSQVVTYPLS